MNIRNGVSSTGLPEEVVNCLNNARFLHLATSNNDCPHVSLMKYTYLPSTPFSSTPTIIMTTPPSSQKTLNLEANPRVSILVHDWVSHRPPTLSSSPGTAMNSSTDHHRSSLANLLLSLNSASLSRISVSLNGAAQFLEPGSEEETWCKTQHREHNRFEETSDESALGAGAEDRGAGSYISGEQVRVVVVKIKGGRISDSNETVTDFALQQEESSHGIPVGNHA
ncbi:Pyridoxamine 5'-phosphate oxidase [Venturia nashicola]|uniref:Pyridoxamine 5'-phosphate oxidase n=1 Tax=Venturia nashicola TaxID=86259 RepID=A0A4Z1NLX0_9PEZI|nr:Pyridoxamine 5'-phosphate oxidase [Venturia nashicola]TLD25779.1 Pyridoxamine 5'-phosphate oxidase [Venturia nashicola]